MPLQCSQGFFSFCSGVVLQVLFHPKQLTLVTAGDDADVRVWDLVSKSCVAVLKVGPQGCPAPPPLLSDPAPSPLCQQELLHSMFCSCLSKERQ